MMTMIPPQLDSLARIAVALQMPPSALMRIAATAGIAPTMLVNGRPLFDADAAEKLAQLVKNKDSRFAGRGEPPEPSSDMASPKTTFPRRPGARR